MAAYVANCRSCTRRLEVGWDGDPGRLPYPATCPHCGYADGYGKDDAVLVGAFQAVCPECEDAFLAEIPVANVDYGEATGLRGPIELHCRACGQAGWFQPEDVIWLGQGASMPEASGRVAVPGHRTPS